LARDKENQSLDIRFGHWFAALSSPVKTLVVTGVAIGIAGAFSAWRTERMEALATQPPGRWVSLGAQPFAYATDPSNLQSGRVAAIAVNPRNVAHWLVGAGNGGIWETRDAGASFAPIADDAPTLSVGAVAFAASDPDIIYVGTGEAAGVSFAHVGVGILKSTNGGQTWELLGQSAFGRSSIRRLRVDPNDANVVLAASARGGAGRDARESAPSPPPFGIVKSTDGGRTWSRTLAGQATALEVDPMNFNRQYAAIGDQRLGVWNDTPGASPNGLYRSTNAGVSWSRVEGPWGPDPSPTRSTAGRIELAIAPSNPNVLYAAIQIPPNGGASNTGLLGVFRTDNAWADSPTWIQIATEATPPGGYCGPGKCGYSHVISVDPLDANTLFAGGADEGFWRCTNCGSSPTWTNTTQNARVHPDHHALAWAGNRLINGNDGGVWSTTDLGATWENHNRSLPLKMFYSGALHPTDRHFALGSARDFRLGVYRADVGWRILAQPRGEGVSAISSARPDTDWMASQLRGLIQRTTDGGQTVLQVDGAIDKTGIAFVAPIEKCPANDDVFLIGTVRMWRTNNFFNSSVPSWTAISPARPFPGQGFHALNDPGTIHSIAFIEDDRECNSFAYGNRGGDVRLTRDGGATWIDIDPARSLPARTVNSLVFEPGNPNRAFAAVSSYDEATPGRPGHIFRTDNALSPSPTWTRVGPPDVPFANMPFNVIAIDPNNTRIVYAGSDNGLWQSSDGGTSWTKIGLDAGLPPVSVYDVQINLKTERTVIFTYGRGAFELAR
jgi:photosystem II stability/assembly factor-like uncharacterized protein